MTTNRSEPVTGENGVHLSLEPSTPPPKRRWWIPVVIVAGATGVGIGGWAMMRRAESRENKESLSQSAKPVSVATVKSAHFQPQRLYVGTLEPWIQANIGPQLVSAYVDTVLVRPGATVKRGEVLATLDCRTTSAASQAVAMQARAIDERQQALEHESTRIQAMLDGGFVSPNEAEQKRAAARTEAAQLLATKAKLAGTALEVNDCVLRAPFDGEIGMRSIDPGAFVRPGVTMLSVVDRATVRLTGDVPEIDVGVVEPGKPVKLTVIATGKDLTGVISRRSPSADPGTRTVHFEVDIADPKKDIPVNTTADVHVDAGDPIPAMEVPLSAAIVRGSKATLYVVENELAHARAFQVIGEEGGSLFLAPDPRLVPGAHIVTEGRALLVDGDRVSEKEDPAFAAPPEGSAR